MFELSLFSLNFFKKTLMVMLFLFFNILAEAKQKRVGLFYPIGEKNEKYLFKQVSEIEIKDDLNRNTFSEILDADGKVLLRETASVVNGQIKNQTMDVFQIDERYQLDVVDGRAQFKTFDIKDVKNPKLKSENRVKINDLFYTGPSLELFIKKHIIDSKNKNKKFEFGIFELEKPITFDLGPTKKIFKDADDLMPLKLEVNSFLFSLFADPLYLEVDPKTAAMKRYRGRTPVRIMKNNKLVPFDGDIYYEITN